MRKQQKPGGIRLRLPATSANLGPGFDAVAVALDFFLEIAAEPADGFSLVAVGRDADRCAQLEDNLILQTYHQVLRDNGREVLPLSIRLDNAIPLGMGCGSSAAARLAAIALANHFGQLDWNAGRILEQACALEGHPDNVAACWLGGFVTAVAEANHLCAVPVKPPPDWRAIVALPSAPLSTSEARAMLPANYPLADVVANLQSVAILVLAFAQARGDLLRWAMSDRIHQPYRAPSCPLFSLLHPLVGTHGILGLSLSGAGPAVLLIVDGESSLAPAGAAIARAAANRLDVELLKCRFYQPTSPQLLENKGH